jgi:hypothetical protein
MADKKKRVEGTGVEGSKGKPLRFDDVMVNVVATFAHVARAGATDHSLIQRLPRSVLANVVLPMLNFDDRANLWPVSFSIAKKIAERDPPAPVGLFCDANDWRYFCTDHFTTLCTWLRPAAEKTITRLHMKHIPTMLRDWRSQTSDYSGERFVEFLALFKTLTDVQFDFYDPYVRMATNVDVDRSQWIGWLKEVRGRLRRLSIQVRRFGTSGWDGPRGSPSILDAIQAYDGKDNVWPLEVFECPDLHWPAFRYKNQPLPAFPFGPRLRELDLLLYVLTPGPGESTVAEWLAKLIAAVPTLVVLRLRFCMDNAYQYAELCDEKNSPTWLSMVVDAYNSTLQELQWVTDTASTVLNHPLLKHDSDIRPLVKCKGLRILVLNLAPDFQPRNHFDAVLTNNRELVHFGCKTRLHQPSVMKQLARCCPQLQRADLLHRVNTDAYLHDPVGSDQQYGLSEDTRERVRAFMSEYAEAWQSLVQACTGLQQLPDMRAPGQLFHLEMKTLHNLVQLRELRLFVWCDVPSAHTKDSFLRSVFSSCRHLRHLDVHARLDRSLWQYMIMSLKQLRHLCWYMHDGSGALGEDAWTTLADACPLLESIEVSHTYAGKDEPTLSFNRADGNHLVTVCPNLRWIRINHSYLTSDLSEADGSLVRRGCAVLLQTDGWHRGHVFTQGKPRYGTEGQAYLLDELFV